MVDCLRSQRINVTEVCQVNPETRRKRFKAYHDRLSKSVSSYSPKCSAFYFVAGTFFLAALIVLIPAIFSAKQSYIIAFGLLLGGGAISLLIACSCSMPRSHGDRIEDTGPSQGPRTPVTVKNMMNIVQQVDVDLKTMPSDQLHGVKTKRWAYAASRVLESNLNPSHDLVL